MERGIIMIVLGLMFVACQDEPDCISVTTDFANLRFYSIENNDFDTVIVNSLSPLASDSVLLEDTTITDVIRLPLNPNTTTTTFAFDTEFGIDTLILSYNTSTRLIADDCGLEVLFTDLESTRNDFDSIRIVNDILIEDINEDIRIFN